MFSVFGCASTVGFALLTHASIVCVWLGGLLWLLQRKMGCPSREPSGHISSSSDPGDLPGSVKTRRLDLEVSRISYPGMELSRGFLQFSVPGWSCRKQWNMDGWADENGYIVTGVRQRKAWDVRQSGERGMMDSSSKAIYLSWTVGFIVAVACGWVEERE